MCVVTINPLTFDLKQHEIFVGQVFVGRRTKATERLGFAQFGLIEALLARQTGQCLAG